MNDNLKSLPPGCETKNRKKLLWAVAKALDTACAVKEITSQKVKARKDLLHGVRAIPMKSIPLDGWKDNSEKIRQSAWRVRNALFKSARRKATRCGFYTTQWRNGRSSGVLLDEHFGSFAGVGGANVELACGEGAGTWAGAEAASKNTMPGM